MSSGEDLTEIRCHQADQARVNGDYARARAAWATLHPAVARVPDARVATTCLLMEAHFENEVARPEAAALALERAESLRTSAGDRGGPSEEVLQTLAHTYSRQGRHRDAIATMRRAIASLDAKGRGGTSLHGVLSHNLGVFLLQAGETIEAERLLHEVIRRLSVGDGAAALPQQPLVHYGHAALARGRADSARDYFARLAEQAARDGSGYWEGRGLFGLALAEVGLGRTEDARRTAARFDRLKDRKDLLQVDDQITDARVLAAWLALADGDAARAHGLVTDALHEHGYFDGRRRRVLRAPLVLAAETALRSGHPRVAADLAADAREIATVDALASTRSGFVGEARLVEARAALALGDTLSARPALELAHRALRHGFGEEHARTREAAVLLERMSR